MKRLAWAGAILGSLAAAVFALLGAVATFSPDVPWPPVAWSPPEGPYKVAVLGDIQKGLTNARNLVEEFRRAGVSLTLQSGDLVSENDDGHYRLAARALRKLPGSFRAVPGNHDVKGGYRRWTEAFGETEFVLPGPVAFVGLDNSDGRPLDLESLERRTAGKEAVVLVFHVPNFDPAFVAWLEKSPRVKYVFNGHAHEYAERTIGSTTVIVNGVGGDYDSWQFDQKVYAVLLEVDGASIRHRAITLPPEHGIWDNLEHAALGHAGPAAWLGALLALGPVLACVKIIKNKKRIS